MRSTNFRTLLRGRALDALALGARLDGRMEAGLRRPRVHMLYGHSLASSDLGNFRAMLGWLGDRYKLVAYEEAIRRIHRGPIDEATVSFSFDDGFRSCLAAADILADFGVKACFFVCPALIGVTDQRRISAAFGSVSAHETTMTWADVERLRAQGHEIGGHTMTHVNLAAVSRDRAADEIGRSFEVLRSRLGDVRHFAWPFGRLRHVNASSAQTVFSTGYQTCASALRGCHVEPVAERTQLCVRREHVEFDWPLGHIWYFLARSAVRASGDMNGWPNDWRVGDGSMQTKGRSNAS